jgi:epoxyqueuosine reductase
LYLDWIAAGHHGDQAYLARPDRLARRRDLRVILPGVHSLVVVGLHYWPGPPSPEADDPARGRISCYALGPDYHQVMLSKLESLLDFIKSTVDGTVRGRAYVDTGPLLERDHALRAGLGFAGKNCSLIQPRRGSWFFLGELLLADCTPLEPEARTQLPDCGTCTRCLEACPTGALVQPHTLDSRRCISYLTTSLKGTIPRDLRPLLQNRIFGCDVCQAVCPWNRFARPVITSEVDLVHAAPPLLKLARLSEKGFGARFGRTPLGRLKRQRFLRTVAVALGNWGAPEATSALREVMADPSPLIRGHAAWALGEIGTARARAFLEGAFLRETDATVIKEIQLALGR